MSKTSQNDSLDCMAKVVLEEILHNVRNQSQVTEPFFGLQADEITACHHCSVS